VTSPSWGPHPVGCLVVAGGLEGGQGVEVVLLLLLETLTFALELGLRLLLFAQPFAFLALGFLLLRQHLLVVGGELELLEPETVVPGPDPDGHGLAELLDGRGDLVEPVDGGVELVRLHAADQVVGFGVVGAEQGSATGARSRSAVLLGTLGSELTSPKQPGFGTARPDGRWWASLARPTVTTTICFRGEP